MNKLKKLLSIFVILTLSLNTGINAQNIDNYTENKTNNNQKDRKQIGNLSHYDLKNLPEETYHPGKLRIKFSRDFEESLKSIDFELSDNNQIKTGIADLDRLNKTYGVNEYTPLLEELYMLSEASHKYKERHKSWGFHLWYDLKLDNRADIIEAIINFEKLKEVKIAEPAFIKKLIEPVDSRPVKDNFRGSGWTPNDPYYANQQWHFNNTGQHGGTPGWDCNAEAAWGLEKGDTNVVVAIIDSGMEYLHEDLEGNMWEDIGPQGTNTPAGSHGTHVGGTVAAVSNNNTGVAGLAGGSGNNDGVRLMTIHALGSGSVNMVTAFTYAADNGAAITQNSWSYGPGGTIPSSVANAIDYFNANGGGDAMDGGITICAAGNYSSTGLIYPAAYEGSMAVASHDNNGNKSGFSSYGSWVDIIAPGSNVTSTEIGNAYSAKSGTSMATPHVSGAAALVISNAYGDITNDELWDILVDSANDDIYQENPNYTGQLGSGRLDAYAALRKLGPMVTFEIEDENENPIDSAIITLNGETNQPGEYVFTNVEEGSHDYKIEKEGYFTVEDEVTVEDDTTVEVTMFEKYTVTFEIDDEHGNEITEAVITLDGEKNEPGNYVFENIKDGTFDYKVEKDGYFTAEDEVTIEGDATVEVTLYGAYRVTFDVEDTWGNVVENAVITFDGVQQGPGEYVFKEIKSGTYEYKVEKDEYYTVENNITLNNNYIARVILEPDGTYTDGHEDAKLSIFPNPTRNKFNVESNVKIKEIRLIDLSGQVITDIAVDDLTSVINVSGFRPGVYFMEIHTKENVITKRVQITQ